MSSAGPSLRSRRLVAALVLAALVGAGCAGAPGVEVTTAPGSAEPAPAAPDAAASDPTGVEGEDLCSGFASGDEVAYSGLTCTWSANGTWELPAEYTTSDWWITVQGLGGVGGAGAPTDQAGGGAAGQAQATFSGDELDGETLYLYVGLDGYDTEDTTSSDVPYGGTGGAGTMITTSAVDWSSGTTAADVDALVVAGAGGGGGLVSDGSASAAGGAGGIAVATTETLFGSGTGGDYGSDAYGGQAPDYDGDAYDGDQHVSGGYSASDDGDGVGDGEVALGGGYSEGVSGEQPWVNNSATLSLEDNVMEGGRADVGGGAGGGGHAGGGGGATSWIATGSSTGAGGGGGSSWALGGDGDPPTAAESWFDLDATSSAAAVTVWADNPTAVSSTQTMYVVNGDSYLTTGAGSEDGSPEGVVTLDLAFDLTADPYTATLANEPLFYLYEVDDSTSGDTYSQYASLVPKTGSTMTVGRGAGVVGGSFELVEGPSDQLASLGTANLSGTYDLVAGTASIDVTYAGSVVGHLELVSAGAVVEVTRSGEGSVTSDPDGITCGSRFCTATFSEDTVTLTATPDAGHTFSAWGGACSGSDTTCTLSGLSLPSTTDVSATFTTSSGVATTPSRP